jgi:hypothetical protein
MWIPGPIVKCLKDGVIAKVGVLQERQVSDRHMHQMLMSSADDHGEPAGVRLCHDLCRSRATAHMSQPVGGVHGQE